MRAYYSSWKGIKAAKQGYARDKLLIISCRGGSTTRDQVATSPLDMEIRTSATSPVQGGRICHGQAICFVDD
jgi:hypothetical protein